MSWHKASKSFLVAQLKEAQEQLDLIKELEKEPGAPSYVERRNYWRAVRNRARLAMQQPSWNERPD